jgi:oxygen-independent coproporphyrinogen-3 oxidase
VASFGHVQGWHCQNLDRMEDYLAALREGRLPTNRALQPTVEQLLIREFVLQLKEGRASRSAFQAKFGVDVVERFREQLDRQRAAGYLDFGEEGVTLTRKGLLQVDSLLWEYFEPEFRQVRYT